uniref:Intraflagellar transport protein 46 homolog n=1 Tax=Caenorhabditis tropicalis TaxID=1561998 RepID=A0A1I7U1E5_9PELO
MPSSLPTDSDRSDDEDEVEPGEADLTLHVDPNAPFDIENYLRLPEDIETYDVDRLLRRLIENDHDVTRRRPRTARRDRRPADSPQRSPPPHEPDDDDDDDLFDTRQDFRNLIDFLRRSVAAPPQQEPPPPAHQQRMETRGSQAPEPDMDEMSENQLQEIIDDFDEYFRQRNP